MGQAEEQVMKKGGTLTKSTAIKVKVGIALKLINCTYLQSASRVSFHSTLTKIVMFSFTLKQDGELNYFIPACVI